MISCQICCWKYWTLHTLLTLWALKTSWNIQTSSTFYTLWTVALLDLVNLVLKLKKVRYAGWTAVAEIPYLYKTPSLQWFCTAAGLFWLSELWDWRAFPLVFNRFLKQVCLAVYMGYQSHLFTHTVPQFWGCWEKKATALSNFANLIWYRFFGELCTCFVKV